jgi:AbrB family looped-hinge helix DNA binding protein
MTKKEVELIARLGPKGQIVLRKELREVIGIKPGSLVTETVRDDEIVIKPIREEETIERVRKIAKQVGKSWPKDLNSVELIREQRR